VSGLHQEGERQRQGSLEAHDPERGAVEGLILLVRRVRRVVGSEAVDGAVRDGLEHRLAVAG